MSRSPLYVGLAVLLGLTALALAADIEDCTENDELGQFVEATIAGCSDDDTKCPLHRGQNASITIKFKTKKEIKSVQQVVHGSLPAVPIPVPFPLESPDACQNTGLTCPLPAAGDFTYTYSIFVKPTFPKVSVNVKWELLNEDQKQIVCVKVPSTLK
ncbi:hypothetical protein ONE63_007173 [Megalurothrips usitatus]|uniref:MD-2-related lipid-recognition domain-containing protein n=1 Tax=Megalurothrips usitatus TaxID=439358 RepID=A0AAV7XW27_9NEOP|nr:hypothetical protein ONE63_007173 [Megalurothrips usitatus]